MRHIVFFTLLSGCVVVDAPESFEELVVFGFVHYDAPPSSTRPSWTASHLTSTPTQKN
jgi:hypothetical protein